MSHEGCSNAISVIMSPAPTPLWALLHATSRSVTMVAVKPGRKLKKAFQICEGVILATAILVIIGLFSIPTVFYALPPSHVSESPVLRSFLVQ